MENIGDGVKLMVIGMGMVFVFLTIMVFVIALFSKILEPFAHIFEEKPTAIKTAKKSNNSQENDIIVAITSAVHKYRSEH